MTSNINTNRNQADVDIRQRLENSLSLMKVSASAEYRHHKHFGMFDSCMYNGGTVVILVITGLATFLPVEGSWYLSPRLMSGAAAILITIDRALTFGSRWKFHMEMSNSYRIFLDRIDVFFASDNEDWSRKFSQLLSLLEALRRRESAIPGVTMSNASASAEDSNTIH